jgi:hypothetical protein
MLISININTSKSASVFREAVIYFRHASEGRHPDPNQRGQRPPPIKNWIPAFAGTTHKAEVR